MLNTSYNVNTGANDTDDNKPPDDEYTSGYFGFFIVVLAIQVNIVIFGCIYVDRHSRSHNAPWSIYPRSQRLVFQDLFRIIIQVLGLVAAVGDMNGHLVLLFWIIFDIFVLCGSLAALAIELEQLEIETVTCFYLLYSGFSLVFGTAARILVMLGSDAGHDLFPISYGLFPLLLALSTCVNIEDKKRILLIFVGVVWTMGIGVMTPIDSSLLEKCVWGGRWLLFVIWMLLLAFKLTLHCVEKGKAGSILNEAMLLVSLSFCIWTANYCSQYPDSSLQFLQFFWVIPSIVTTIMYDYYAYNLYMVRQRQHMLQQMNNNANTEGNIGAAQVPSRVVTARKPKKRTFRHLINLIQKRGMPNGCSICWEEFSESNDENLQLGFFKTCGHPFHLECIKNWLKIATLCPVCRAGSNESGLIQISYLQLNRAVVPAPTGAAAENAEVETDAGGTSDPQTCESRGTQTDHRPATCSICDRHFTGDPHHLIVAFITQCGHYFHTGCVYTDDSNHVQLNKCPTCNADVEDGNNEVEVTHTLLSQILTARQSRHSV